jgi:alkylation response protein AidB-like acyl-CoA dehydrogenase
LAGVAEAARDMAVSYAATRVQFGQLIGAFQAVKHACADMAMRAEAAAAQTFYAALLVTAGNADTASDVASARLIAGKAALDNAKANIQVHGGMGFTQECDAHLYLKRAQLFSALNGSRARQLAQLAP